MLSHGFWPSGLWPRSPPASSLPVPAFGQGSMLEPRDSRYLSLIDRLFADIERTSARPRSLAFPFKSPDPSELPIPFYVASNDEATAAATTTTQVARTLFVSSDITDTDYYCHGFISYSPPASELPIPHFSSDHDDSNVDQANSCVAEVQVEIVSEGEEEEEESSGQHYRDVVKDIMQEILDLLSDFDCGPSDSTAYERPTEINKVPGKVVLQDINNNSSTVVPAPQATQKSSAVSKKTVGGRKKAAKPKGPRCMQKGSCHKSGPVSQYAGGKENLA